MKKPEITNGEWEVKKFGGASELYKVVSSKRRDEICSMGIFGMTNTKDHEEEKANAQAISAVPEMLDALLEVCDHIDMHSCNLPASAKNKTRQALKKAGYKEWP